MLRELEREHETLLTLSAEHREAITRADAGALRRCVAAQRQATARIQELDRRRRGIAAGILPGPEQKVAAVADALGEPWGRRVLDAGRSLRAAVERVNAENRVLAAAASSLLGHMNGLIAQVGRSLSHTGTYTRRGSVEAGAQVVSGMDVKL